MTGFVFNEHYFPLIQYILCWNCWLNSIDNVYEMICFLKFSGFDHPEHAMRISLYWDEQFMSVLSHRFTLGKMSNMCQKQWLNRVEWLLEDNSDEFLKNMSHFWSDIIKFDNPKFWVWWVFFLFMGRKGESWMRGYQAWWVLETLRLNRDWG